MKTNPTIPQIILCALISGLIALPSLAQTQIFAFGDSITLGLRDSGVDCDNPATARGYPAILEDLLTDRGIDNTVSNFGVCGETTAEGLARIPSVISQPGDVILLMEGTNDISAQIGIESMVFNLTEMSRLAQDEGFEPVVSSIIPRGPETSPDTNNVRTSFYGFRIGEEAADRDLPYADPLNIFLNLEDAFDRFYDEDGFHLNSLGYNVLANTFLEPTIEAATRSDVQPCVPDATTLCLNNGRFKIQADWTDFEGASGVGTAVGLTGDTGYFWFFNNTNVELVIKALDGRCINDHFWIFYGALSNVEYTITVTDSETGRRRVYRNELNNFASNGDTQAFAVPRGDCSSEVRLADPEPDLDLASMSMIQIPATAVQPKTPANGPCEPTNTVLCLNGERFELQVDWLTPAGLEGDGKAVSLTEDTGYFWFFNEANVELVVKVLDGREINGNFWVFYGSLTNGLFDLKVVDLETGAEINYFNPQSNFASVGDILAFPGDP